MTAQGSPYAIFRRAIEREKVTVAEIQARMMSRMAFTDALDLTALIALKDPRRRSRQAARWLGRWLAETPGATLR